MTTVVYFVDETRPQEAERDVSAYFEKVALMAATGLIFGQFVPEAQIDWWVVVVGSVLSLALITLAGLLSKEDQRKHTFTNL